MLRKSSPPPPTEKLAFNSILVYLRYALSCPGSPVFPFAIKVILISTNCPAGLPVLFSILYWSVFPPVSVTFHFLESTTSLPSAFFSLRILTIASSNDSALSLARSSFFFVFAVDVLEESSKSISSVGSSVSLPQTLLADERTSSFDILISNSASGPSFFIASFLAFSILSSISLATSSANPLSNSADSVLNLESLLTESLVSNSLNLSSDPKASIYGALAANLAALPAPSTGGIIITAFIGVALFA